MDYRGYTSRVSVWLTDATAAAVLTDAATFATDLVACSNAVLFRQTGGNLHVNNSTSRGAAAQYANISQKAVLRILGSDGRIHRLAIPAPKAAIFQTDQVTVNLGAANISTLVTFLNSFWTSEDGTGTTGTVLSGYFEDRKRKYKLGIYTRTSTGTDDPAP
jgi:hypothetical protein